MTSHRSETTQIDTRARLIEQNKKLRNEIVQLSHKVDEVIQKKSATTVKKQQQYPTQLDDKKKQLKQQQQYILKLKSKIQQLRLSMTTAVDSMNRQQEDKLTKLKKQLKTLDEEKATLQKLKFDKTKVLKDRDHPHEQVKGQLQEMIATVKLENKDLFDKIMVLERQIRKEHEMAVGFKDKDEPNIDNLPEIEAEIKQLEQKKKAIEDKWTGKMEYLDTQFLQLKSAFDNKKKKLDQLTKEVKNWEIRKFVYRDQDSINEVKQMLARLPVKPRSQTNTSKNSKAVSMSMIESKPDRTGPIEISTSKDNFRQVSPPPKPLDRSFEAPEPKKTKNQQPTNIVQASLIHVAKTERIELKKSKQITKKESNQKPKDGPRQSSKQPKAHNHRHLESSIQTAQHKNKITVNEFLQVSPTFVKQSESQKKEKKLLKSIAIGTTFYYNPNDS